MQQKHLLGCLTVQLYLLIKAIDGRLSSPRQRELKTAKDIQGSIPGSLGPEGSPKLCSGTLEVGNRLRSLHGQLVESPALVIGVILHPLKLQKKRLEAPRICQGICVRARCITGLLEDVDGLNEDFDSFNNVSDSESE